MAKPKKVTSFAIGIRCFDLEITEHICLNPNCARETSNVRLEFNLEFDLAREIVENARKMVNDHIDSDLYFIIRLAVEEKGENNDGKESEET